MGALDYKTRRHRRNRLAAELAATYGPRRHFRLGQDIGWHWQFDNPLTRVGIAYEWTDTAGTTPVTAVGQGIGLLLGREYGGATGPSLLANGATGLTGAATAASYSTTTFAGSVSRAGDASNQSWVTWTGLATSAVHRIRITNTGATSLDVRNGGVAGTIVASIAAGASSWVHPATTGGSTSITITATANSTTATFTLGQFAVLPGTHLTQATGTAKPTLSARVNLLTYTEDFSNATWVKTSATATANTITPTASTVGRVLQTVTVAANGGALKAYFEIKQGTSAQSRLLVRDDTNSVNFAQTTGVTWSGGVPTIGSIIAGSWSTPVAVGDGWYSVTATGTPGAGASISVGVHVYPDNLSGTGTLLVRKVDLRTADDAAKNIPAYQRVGATAADHDTDGYPHFAEGDGTDNAWASVATVDGSGSDKVTVVAAVTKNSDAAAGCVLELTANSGSTTNSFGMFAPSSAAANFNFGSHGSASVVQVTETGPASPKTAVLGGYADITGDSVVLARDGVSVASSSTDQGTGNFANATLYVLSRGGSSVRFNGRFYGSTGRFGPMSDSERNSLTRWWQKRIGAA